MQSSSSQLGQVFSCGNGSDGCLGLGDAISESSSLLPIDSLIGVPIQQIVAGGEHSMALSLSGKIFSWGRNKKGRLGIGTETNSIISTPFCIDSTELPPFKHIATGPSHSAAIGPRGRLFLCGDNSECQLGQDPGTGWYMFWDMRWVML